jgi:precorrin-6B methylase 2
MIEAIIKEAPNKLAPSGRLLMTHNSMANLSKSLHLFESVGMQHRVLAKRPIGGQPAQHVNWL